MGLFIGRVFRVPSSSALILSWEIAMYLSAVSDPIPLRLCLMAAIIEVPVPR